MSLFFPRLITRFFIRTYVIRTSRFLLKKRVDKRSFGKACFFYIFDWFFYLVAYLLALCILTFFLNLFYPFLQYILNFRGESWAKIFSNASHTMYFIFPCNWNKMKLNQSSIKGRKGKQVGRVEPLRQGILVIRAGGHCHHLPHFFAKHACSI